jgi:glycosyltransferase involved in cell wall biosynthesis
MPTILRTIAREDHTSIFNSVYVQSAEALKKQGWDIQFLLFSFLGNWIRRNPREQSHKLDQQLAGQFNHSPIRLPLPPSRLSFLWGSGHALRTYNLLSIKNKMRNQNLILEGNNSEATSALVYAFGSKRREPIIYRCWGIDEEEYLLANTGQCSRENIPKSHEKEALRLHFRQQLAVYQADHIICVSQAMVDHLSNKFQCDRRKTSVVPCAVSTKHFFQEQTRREKTRRELGLENKLVVAYCGAMQSYQLPQQGLQLFKRLLNMEPKLHYLAITRDRQVLLELCERENIPEHSRTIISLNHQDVPKALCAADIGLLLRDKCPVNMVASPVKFGEYMAAGLPVIISKEIGDYSALVEKLSLGVVLNETSLCPSDAQRILDTIHSRAKLTEKCNETAKALDTEESAKKICLLYTSILESRMRQQ